jgi:hypothetical protein
MKDWRFHDDANTTVTPFTPTLIVQRACATHHIDRIVPAAINKNGSDVNTNLQAREQQ